ncbi:hypothetical protein KL945_001695 [Ogataea haglerorum]|nr:hypothetical protein KL945_001695 [Ogataea haglerorum]
MVQRVSQGLGYLGAEAGPDVSDFVQAAVPRGGVAQLLRDLGLQHQQLQIKHDAPLQHALLLGRGDLGDDQKNHAVDRPGSEALDRSGDYEHQHRLGRAAQNTAQAEHGQGDQHDGLSSAALGGLAADRDHRGLGQSERSGTQVAALALSVNWVDMVESATVTTVWSRAARKIAITRPPMISLRSV